MSWEISRLRSPLYTQVCVDVTAQPGHLIIGQAVDACVGIDTGCSTNLLGDAAPNPIDIRQRNLNPLLGAGCLHQRCVPSQLALCVMFAIPLGTGDWSSRDGTQVATGTYPCLCLWRGFSQITITRRRRRMILHRSHSFLTLGLTFICPPAQRQQNAAALRAPCWLGTVVLRLLPPLTCSDK